MRLPSPDVVNYYIQRQLNSFVFKESSSFDSTWGRGCQRSEGLWALLWRRHLMGSRHAWDRNQSCQNTARTFQQGTRAFSSPDSCFHTAIWCGHRATGSKGKKEVHRKRTRMAQLPLTPCPMLANSWMHKGLGAEQYWIQNSHRYWVQIHSETGELVVESCFVGKC